MDKKSNCIFDCTCVSINNAIQIISRFNPDYVLLSGTDIQKLKKYNTIWIKHVKVVHINGESQIYTSMIASKHDLEFNYFNEIRTGILII